MSTLTLGGSIVNVNARQREGVGGKKEVNFGQRKLWTSPYEEFPVLRNSQGYNWNIEKIKKKIFIRFAEMIKNVSTYENGRWQIP